MQPPLIRWQWAKVPSNLRVFEVFLTPGHIGLQNVGPILSPKHGPLHRRPWLQTALGGVMKKPATALVYRPTKGRSDLLGVTEYIIYIINIYIYVAYRGLHNISNNLAIS